MVDNLKTKIANRILFLLFYRASRNYWRRTAHLEKIQENYLLKLIRLNARVKFGVEHKFNSIKSIYDFQNLVPVSDHESYLEYIKEIKAGKSNVLTIHPVKKFSLSSGTATASKLIPNNKTLLNEFDKCISVWLFDLYQHFPQLLNGKSFWIISPSTKTSEQQNNIKNGFENDSEYFSPIKQWLIRQVFVIPDEVAGFCQGENYYFVLGTFLVAEKNLRLISVWNPSLLFILFEKILRYKNEIIKSLETGHLFTPDEMDSNHLLILGKKLPRKPQRIKELKEIFLSQAGTKKMWPKIWPELELISAWDSVWASIPAKQLKEIFPKVAFQGKGLLATEACVTFPVYYKNIRYSYYPAYTSHFFEFEQVEGKEIKLLHQLEINCSYEVIVTTGGGFYRYRLNDLVRCYRYENGLPLLHFEGKSNQVSDILGEKLHENHIEQLLNNLFQSLKIESTFYFLAPEKVDEKIFYVLFIHTEKKINTAELQIGLEAGLCENFHYRHCRTLEQLSESSVYWLNDDAFQKFYTELQKKQPSGTFKQSILRKETFWMSKLDFKSGRS